MTTATYTAASAAIRSANGKLANIRRSRNPAATMAEIRAGIHYATSAGCTSPALDRLAKRYSRLHDAAMEVANRCANALERGEDLVNIPRAEHWNEDDAETWRNDAGFVEVEEPEDVHYAMAFRSMEQEERFWREVEERDWEAIAADEEAERLQREAEEAAKAEEAFAAFAADVDGMAAAVARPIPAGLESTAPPTTLEEAERRADSAILELEASAAAMERAEVAAVKAEGGEAYQAAEAAVEDAAARYDVARTIMEEVEEAVIELRQQEPAGQMTEPAVPAAPSRGESKTNGTAASSNATADPGLILLAETASAEPTVPAADDQAATINLRGANLRGARINLEGADLRGVAINLEGALLGGAE